MNTRTAVIYSILFLSLLLIFSCTTTSPKTEKTIRSKGFFQSVKSGEYAEVQKFIEKDVMVNLYDTEALRTTAYENEWSHFSPHVLRHTRITHLVERDKKELLWVQKFAGHENLNTTGNYFHVRI